MRIRINLKAVLLYAAYALALVCLTSALPGAPFALGLFFAMLICGTNIIATPVLFVLSSIITLDWLTIALSAFEALFLTAVALIYRRTGRRIKFEAAAYIAIALAPFVAFSHWNGVTSLYFTGNVYLIKAAAAIAVMLFTFFACRSVYALLFRLYRCKLRTDELLCLCVLFVVCGVGAYNLIGLEVYLCLGAGLTAFAVRLARSPSAVIFCTLIGIPCAIASLNFDYITAFVVLSIISLLFINAGRAAPSAVCFILSAVYFYFAGFFAQGVGLAILRGLLLFCCCLAPLIPTDKQLENQRDLLAVRKVVPRAREERFTEYVADRLFRTSEVFREIESAFTALDDTVDTVALKQRIFSETKRKMCENCNKKLSCAHTKVYRGYAMLIDAGCAKGKVSLVDLPAEVTANCNDVTALIDVLNKQLYEFRKMTMEAENAHNGRKLLAGQARGVAEVLKARAVELNKRSEDCSALESEVTQKLVECGISCPEIRIFGGSTHEIIVTIVGNTRVSAVKECIENTLGAKLLLKDKITYDTLKCAYVFVEPPKYDAAFGVAYAVKDGEQLSGDTHSVIKINEQSFLMVLSDGMGSGEYAQKVSSTAISLIEAFYRAEMPAEIVLDTINKLLCFNRDERFTCIDVAAIDLNTLTASFIKIGSPAGIIVRKGEIKVLESHSLPLGILDNLHPATCLENLKCDDIVVFMSDGITASFSTAQELYEYLQTLKPLNPQSLADKILAEAKSRVEGTPDDMTVLCVRIFKRQVE